MNVYSTQYLLLAILDDLLRSFSIDGTACSLSKYDLQLYKMHRIKQD